MERTPSILSTSSRSSSRASDSRNSEPLLPYSEKPVIKVRSLLGHCLYRRVFIWTVVSLVLAAIVLFRHNDVPVSDVVSVHIADQESDREQYHNAHTNLNGPEINDLPVKSPSGSAIVVVVSDEDEDLQEPWEESEEEEVEKYESQDDFGYEEEDTQLEELDEAVDEEEDVMMQQKEAEELRRYPWIRFKHLNGYFHGLKSLVNKAYHEPEYPNRKRPAPYTKPPPLHHDMPKPQPYSPYDPNDETVRTCYLDGDSKIPAPDILSYDGVPKYMPDPALGSYDIFGIRDDVCFDRFTRYGPYGLGYSRSRGGMGIGMDTEHENSNQVWAKSGYINYNAMDWSHAQSRCSEANSHRFVEPDSETHQLPEQQEGEKVKKGRTAVVVRLYTGFRWTEFAVINFRAMITELSLKSGGEYNVHFLLHIRDSNQPIWSDDVTVQRILDANVPPEFHGLVTIWSEPQMKLFYPGNFENPIQNPSNADVHGVYRSAHLPLQVFAVQHPEYQHFWNWEMDMRYVGNYYELLDRLGGWADKQQRPLLWERSARYYIPSFHGSWDNFSSKVELDTENSGKRPIFGSVNFPGRKPLRSEQRGNSVLPASCAAGREPKDCGVGEPADLITLNPLFDVEESGWVFANDATGYQGIPPRRCAIVTASRLSRRLLLAMHEEVWRHHHTMFTEMFPSTVALHHGLKAVYAPHPVFLDRAWSPASAIDDAFNGGRDHSTSGHGSPFDLQNEHNHKGTSWYYNSEFAGLLWRRWLGYAQKDGRGRRGGKNTEGNDRGGIDEESRKGSSGRLCFRSMLLHPIKKEHPLEG